MKELKIQLLTREAFSPFGEVMELESAEHFTINNGTTERYHKLATADVEGEDAKVIMSVFEGQSFSAPIEIKMMERHPLGSQSFMPLDRRPYVVVVAENGSDNKPMEPQAFLVKANQGVNYFKNSWHHPLISLEDVSQFLVVDRDGGGDNLEEVYFDTPYVIDSLLVAK
jgi:ureidoglycolate lyase